MGATRGVLEVTARGERKALALDFERLHVAARAARAEAWMVCQEARTANVQELARATTMLAVTVAELCRLMARTAEGAGARDE